MLRDQHDYTVMPVPQARRALGKDNHERLLRRVARTGGLDSEDARMLSDTSLPTNLAVVLTITEDDVAKLPEERRKLRNHRGQLLSDREHLIFSTQRRVAVSATLVDLSRGRVRLRKTFRHDAIERKRILRYSGSSLSGSVAATFANTVANGIRTPGWPTAPGVYGSFYNLISEVAAKLPVG